MTNAMTKEALGGEELMGSTAAKYLIPALIGGLGAGSVGAYSSAKTKERPGETPGERRMRILRNALGMGAAGAGLGAAASGLAQTIPNIAPDRTFLEQATGFASDDLSARAGLAGAGGVAGAGLGGLGGLLVDDKLHGAARAAANNHLDSRNWWDWTKEEWPDSTQYGKLRDAALSKHDKAMKPLNAHRMTNIGRGAKWTGMAGALAGFAAPELASLGDSNMGSAAGAAIGGLGGAGLGGLSKNPKGKAIGALLGMLLGGVTPRIGANDIDFTNG